MSTLGRTWHGLWRIFRSDREPWEEAESGGIWLPSALRLALVFALLFGGVFFAFWWAGSAVRFGAARAGDRSAPTWRVSGTVRDALTRQPIPWALVEDDPGGQPPLFRVDADYRGVFSLVTLAEPHRVRVSAPGYRTLSLEIGRAWFVWMPQGSEKKNIELLPLHALVPQDIGVHFGKTLHENKLICKNVLHITFTRCYTRHSRPSTG
jgi:hypothetical protein